MRERPILFNTPMVRAILDECKTKTRRMVKGIPLQWLNEGFTPEFVADSGNDVSPYGYAGDRLWVREAHFFTRYDCDALQLRDHVRYAADGTYCPGRDCVGRSWRPSIHMPRWASRITLEITDVRVERVQSISEQDAIAEGVERHWDEGVVYYGPFDKGHACPKYAFEQLWNSLYPESWKRNDWVWDYTFRRIDA